MKKCIKQNANLSGFTLSELLVVLVIIGILVLLALPSLMPLISKARGLEAKQALKRVHTLQKTYYYEYVKFADNLEDIGFEMESNLSNDPDNPGSANYMIELVEVTNSGFLARATSVVDFDGDGIFNVWEIDHLGNLKEVTKD